MTTAPAPQPTQILLPWAEKEWVDLPRLCRILGCHMRTVYRMRNWRDQRTGCAPFEMVDYGHSLKRVRYSSVVAWCDRLRAEYGIPDRRPPLPNPIFRHKDEDLLPFPLADTIGIPEALRYVPFRSRYSMTARAEQGEFQAYQLIPEAGWPWRISRSDFARWVDAHRG